MWGENSRTIQSSSCKNHTTSLALLINSSNWCCTNECAPAGHNYNCCSERDNEMNLVTYKLILQESYKVTDLLHKFFKLLGVAWWSSSFSPQYPKINSMLRPKLLHDNYQMWCPELNVKWINRKIILREYNISLTHNLQTGFVQEDPCSPRITTAAQKRDERLDLQNYPARIQSYRPSS